MLSSPDKDTQAEDFNGAAFTTFDGQKITV
jgi:hypothetical protein